MSTDCCSIGLSIDVVLTERILGCQGRICGRTGKQETRKQLLHHFRTSSVDYDSPGLCWRSQGCALIWCQLSFDWFDMKLTNSELNGSHTVADMIQAERFSCHWLDLIAGFSYPQMEDWDILKWHFLSHHNIGRDPGQPSLPLSRGESGVVDLCGPRPMESSYAERCSHRVGSNPCR